MIIEQIHNMNTDIQGIGRTIYNMDLGYVSMKRGICILETGLMENEMGKEHCSLARETGIQGNGRMIK